MMKGLKEEALRLAIEKKVWSHALIISAKLSKAAYFGNFFSKINN